MKMTSCLVTVAVIAGISAAVAQPVTASAATAPPANLYVNPVQGSDSAAGTLAAPLLTIQQALNEAGPGTVVHLAAGTYSQNVVTKVNGTASQRIVIEGPYSGTATLFGTGHIMAIANSYYTLERFSIDGQQAMEDKYPVSTWPTNIAQVAAFKSSVSSLAKNDKLVYIDSNSATVGVTGTILDHMTLTGSGGECVRIRNNATYNIIENSTIRYCGMYPVPASGTFAYHNGEGIYIGTSPKSTTLLNYANDQSAGNVIYNDTITTYGSECFDVKENAYANTLTNSVCADNTEPTTNIGSDIELRGYANAVNATQIGASAGYGLKIASDTISEDLGYNNVTSNTFGIQSGGALYDRSLARAGQVCGNVIGSGDPIGDFSKLSGWSSACPA